MNESLREKKILNDLASGASITANGKVYKIEDKFSRKLLQHIRKLPNKTIEPPIGQDKAGDLIDTTQKLDDSEGQLDLLELAEEGGDTPPKMLKLQKLSAYNFRGLQYYNSVVFTYSFKQEPYLLTGVNGAGKTSVLNAIVWAMTGHLLWDRTMPDLPPNVDLKTINNKSSEPQVIKKNWPIHVSIPSLELISASKPNCWVELELVDAEGGSVVVIRRELTGGKESVVGLESLDQLSIDLALLMPGRVNHIQLNKDSQIGKVFFEISGLDSINKYGLFASSNGIGRSLTAQITKLKAQNDLLKQSILNESKLFNQNLPFDIKESYDQVAVTESNSLIRAESRIEWLKDEERERLKHLSSIFSMSNESSELQLSDLSKSILVAYENIKLSSPKKWREAETLLKAIDEWNETAEARWNCVQDEVKQELELAIEWYLKFKESENLRLKIVAAQLLKNSVIEFCPLCEQQLEHTHPLRQELITLNQSSGIALNSISEILNSLKMKINKSIPPSFKHIGLNSIDTILKNGFNNNIGRYLKGNLEPIKMIGYGTIERLLAEEITIDDSEIDYSHLKTLVVEDPSVIELFELFEEELNNCNKQVLLVSWASLNFKVLLENLDTALGFDSGIETTMIGTLTRANNVANSAKPIQTCVEQLQKVLHLFQQKNDAELKINHAEKIKIACADLAVLATISNELLIEDLEKIESELYGTYKRLYGGEDLVLKKITPTGSGRNFSISFWVGFREMLVEASSILNASRIRALLWSYVFSLAKVGHKNPSGDWLDFMIIDEPLTSLDQEHQRTFAQIVFDANEQKQFIVASHDLRWPRELQNLSHSHSISANFISCYGISSQRDSVRLSDWVGQLDVKWKRWMDDNTDIDSGRDYVATAREWCEDEMKDILIWASEPSLARDTLGDLIRKLQKAYESDSFYQIQQVNQLLTSIRLIEVDLQNSHHGCAERRNILQNEIRKVYKHMKKDIPDYVSVIRSTLNHRRGVLTII